MGLTSGLFSTLMLTLAAGALAATVWLWPRVAGRRRRDLGARIGLLLAGQILVIAASLVCINGYFSFFGSWAQVTGTAAPPPLRLAGAGRPARLIQITASDLGPAPGGGSVLPVQADGVIESRPPGAAPAPAGPSQPGATVAGTGGKLPAVRQRQAAPAGTGPVQAVRPGQPGSPAVSGEVLQVSVGGERTGIAVSQDYVYLPPQYFQRAYARARFPVVLALTGYPNQTWSIVKRLALPATAARMAAARKIGPAVYVMMNVSPALPRDTECTNVPAGPQVFSFFAVDVPRAIEQAFRVQSGRSGWAALGYSTGGYCAAKLAMLDPGQFGSAVSMAGYYNAVRDRTTGDLYGGSAAYQNENNLNWRLAHLPAPPVSVLATSSRVGERSLPGTLSFLRLIRAPMHGYSLILPQGGHNYRTWGRELPQALEWLDKRLSPARPRRPGAGPWQPRSAPRR
jgi:enterochelin esterase-like enzyme